MMVASQDYRDGAAYGAQEMARRLVKLSTFGLTLTDKTIRELADGLQYEMGGSDQVESVELPQRWCHCGHLIADVAEPGVYANRAMVRDYCGHCITVRCDAYPGACGPQLPSSEESER